MARASSATAVAALISAAALSGCALDPVPCSGQCSAPTTLSMQMTGGDGFYAQPFPSDARRDPAGHVDLSAFPNPKHVDLVDRVLAILNGASSGFGRTSGIFFQASGRIRAEGLPDVHASVSPGSPVVLLQIDPGPSYLARYPVATAFLEDGGPFGAPNLLSILPLQGVPLPARGQFAAVVLRDLRDASGNELGVSPSLGELVAGGAPAGLGGGALDSYRAALRALRDAGIDLERIAGLTVFTTGTPTDDLDTVVSAMLASPPPSPSSAFVPNEVFDDFCVYQTTIAMPEYQRGTPPYKDSGGDWVFDPGGRPVLQRTEEANFVVTIPRQAMPADGYPIVVFSRTGGGGERPLVDRGTQLIPDGPPAEPGTGPAKYFALAGFAGSSIDGPHGGLRNITHGDEQFLIFNIGNPVALRDNVRQSAAELALQAHLLENLSIDVSGCPGATAPNGVAHFDVGAMAIMGHSMGATIVPLSVAAEPRFRAVLLSGAGGSWIENVIYKEKPVVVKAIAETLVQVGPPGYELSEHDPLLSMFQWAGESADPPVYAERIVRAPPSGAPRHVLMMQGIVDHYIMPPIANATSLSIGLDLAGEALDASNASLVGFAPLRDELGLVGRRTIALPASGNVSAAGDAVTAVVVQHPEDGIEDGHEVVFQTDPPKHEMRCFLQTLKQGVPHVPSTGAALDPCD